MAHNKAHKKQSAANAKLNVHHTMGSSPLVLLLLGAAVLFLWLCGTLVQIQTSEMFALGSHARVANISWGVLQQPYLMVTGQAPIAEVVSWMYAWIVEVVTLVVFLALGVAVYRIRQINHWLGTGFAVVGSLLIILNSYADYNSSPGDSWLVQFLVALALGLIVSVGLPLGLGLIIHGIEEF